MTIYVGNIPFNMKNGDLEQLFSQFGTVKSVKIVTDRDTSRSKGYAFIELGSEDEAKAAIEVMNGRDIEGRNIRVNMATSQGGKK